MSFADVPPSGEPAGGSNITPAGTGPLRRAAPDIDTDRPIPDVFRSPVPPGVSPPKADEFLQVQREDPVAFVRTAPRVEEARAAFELNPTAQTSVRLSRELIKAQLQRGVPADSLTPLTADETRQWAQLVLGIEADDRPEAIRRLTVRLQEMHGRHADLALRSIARHWKDDARSTAFAEALIERMDGVRILPRVRAEAPENTTPEIAPPPESFPALTVDPSRASRLADRQGTPALVRDAEGNFLRGTPLSEAVQVGDAVGFVEHDGEVHLVDGDRHVVLFDDESGRWLVFNRTFFNDQLDRATLLPVAANERTGALSFELPETAKALADAVMLPRDVQDGFVDPLFEEGIRRSFEFGGAFSPATAARAFRQIGTAAARRSARGDFTQQGVTPGQRARPLLNSDRRRTDAFAASHPTANRTNPPFTSANRDGSSVFGHIDEATNKQIIQPHNSVDAMLDLAERSKAPLLQQLETTILDIPGAKVVGVRVKERPRLNEKLVGDRRPDTLGDYLGGRIAVSNPDQFDRVIAVLTSRYKNVEYDDFLDTPRGSGYRAVHMQIVLDNGMTAEIQIMPRDIMKVLDKEHDIYEKWRSKDVYTSVEERQRMADEEWAQDAYTKAYDSWLNQRRAAP